MPNNQIKYCVIKNLPLVIQLNYYLWVAKYFSMGLNRQAEQIKDITIDQIISSIRCTRDSQIDELMNESILMVFLEQHYNTVAISNVKKIFLFKDLMELKNSPLDLSHYSSLITHLKDLKAVTVNPKHPLFLNELRSIFQKYVSVN